MATIENRNTAVVTGASRGIGRAVALRLGSTHHIVALARSLPELETLASDIRAGGGSCDTIELDVADANAVARALGGVRADVLVNNAGVGSFSGPLHEMTPQDWEKVLNTNLRGVFYCIRAFAPMMIRQGGGHIVNISSLAGKNPLPNGAAYAASKWGLNGLTYSVAEELRGKNIRVSVVCPGSVDTTEGWHQGKSSNKMLQPDQIAHVVAMLVTQAPQSFVSEVLIRPTQKP